MGKRRGGGRLPKRDEVVGTAVFPVIRFPHSVSLTANEKDFSLPLEMTIRGKRHTPSILHKESAEEAEVGFALFSFGQPPALRASPFHRKGVDGSLPLLPPSSGRRWRAAPKVGFPDASRKGMGGKHFLVSSSRAQPRDLFRFQFAVFLRKSVCMKHRDP